MFVSDSSLHRAKIYPWDPSPSPFALDQPFRGLYRAVGKNECLLFPSQSRCSGVIDIVTIS